MKFTYIIMFIFLVSIRSTRKHKIANFKYDLSKIEPFDPHAPSGDSKFSKEMHQEEIDYFQIKLNLNSDTNNTEQLLENMTTYFEKWFAVNPETENIIVQFMKGPSGQNLVNRYKVIYNNKKTEQIKTYYIDVDFQNGKSSDLPYRDDQQIPLDDEVMEDPWKKKFEYTLDKECDYIKNYLEIQSGNCANVVNQDNYVISNVYDVVYEDSSGGKNTKRVVVMGGTSISEIGQPTPTESGLIIDPNFREGLKNKLIEDVKKSADNIPDEYKDSLMQKSQLQSQVNNLLDEITNGKEMVESLMKQTERDYQQALRKQLFISRMEKISSFDDHNKTLFLMQQKSEEINAFNIKVQIKRTLRKANFLHNYKIHEQREIYAKEEIQYEELQRKLMDMEYVMDELKDRHYRKMTKMKASQ